MIDATAKTAIEMPMPIRRPVVSSDMVSFSLHCRPAGRSMMKTIGPDYRRQQHHSREAKATSEVKRAKGDTLRQPSYR